MQPLVSAVAALAVLHAAGGVHHHVLKKNEEEIVTFDHTVLGNLNLAEEEAYANLQIPHKHIFTAQLAVGTPPQMMNCLLDSGSADLWLPSKRCQHCSAVHHFKADKSKSFMPAVIRTPDGLMPVPVQVSYGTGDLVGFLVQDHISIAQHRFVNQSFIIVEEEDLPPQRDWDGVCGLGFKQLTDAGLPMYLNVHESEEPIFALIPKGLGPGSTTFLTVGGLPVDSLDMQSLSWAPAVPLVAGSKKSYWVANGKVNINSEPMMKARLLIDTANAYIMAPRSLYKNVLSSLLPDNIFQESCGVDKSAGGLVICDCAATQDNREIWDRRLVVHMGERNYWIRVPHLFKQVEAQETGARKLCLLLVQPAPLALTLDPLEVLSELLAAQGGAKAGGEDPTGLLAPFLIPGLMGGPGAQNLPPGVEQVEEIHRMIDGKQCTNTLVWVDGHLKRNATSCEDRRRKLQGSDAMEDVWVLGGVFLERFSVVFDFQDMRLGFALAGEHESADMTEARTIAVYQNQVALTEGVPWFTNLAIAGLLVGGVYLAYSYFRKFRSRRNLTAGAHANAGESSDEVAGGPNDLAALAE